jgi:lincosamide nucleotidyltransferase A/C/D/E
MGKGGDFMIKKETVTKADLLKVLDLMETSGMRYWLDGGGCAAWETDQGAQGRGY